jgi:hypothetical protein
MSLDGRPLSRGLAARVLWRLGYPEHVNPDLDDLSALYAILRAAGFDARRVVGSMRDLGVANHASVKVRLETHQPLTGLTRIAW